MKAFIAFTKKEFMESIRTYKFAILIIVFLLFGFMNPVIAKVMPEMLQSFLPEGMTITLPPSTAIDSWMQFFKNVSQMGFILLVVLNSGLMATEFSRGTLVNVLTKGLSRSTVVFSKLFASVMIWTLSYLICTVVTYAYTLYFWPSGTVEHLLLALLGLWIFGILLIAFTILGGVLFKTMGGSLIFTGFLVVVMTVINIFPKARPYNPSTISSSNVALLTGGQSIMDFNLSIGIALIAIVVSIIGSVLLFNKKQI